MSVLEKIKSKQVPGGAAQPSEKELLGRFQDWAEGDPVDISVEELDTLVANLRAQREVCDRLKEEKAKAEKLKEKLEGMILEFLRASGKSKYFVDGIGTVYQIEKLVFPTPKSVEQKQALFDYIRQKYGDEALLGYLSMNHNTLNSFAGKEMEVGLKEDPNFKIPGLEEPTRRVTLGMRKDKDKGVSE